MQFALLQRTNGRLKVDFIGVFPSIPKLEQSAARRLRSSFALVVRANGTGDAAFPGEPPRARNPGDVGTPIVAGRRGNSTDFPSPIQSERGSLRRFCLVAWNLSGSPTPQMRHPGSGQATMRVGDDTLTVRTPISVTSGLRVTVVEHSETRRCDECGSDYFAATSRMSRLCPQCAHWLYEHPRCMHTFSGGRCSLCGWDGSVSAYLRRLQSRRAE